MPTPLKSVAQHFVEGTPARTTAKAAAESHITPGRPKYPKGISTDGRRVFKKLCSLLEERRALTKADEEPLRLYCDLHERHTRAVEHLTSEGEVCAYTRLDSNGQPHQQFKQNLWYPIALNSERQMVAILIQLGLTPASRDKVRPTATTKEPEATFDPCAPKTLSGPRVVPFVPVPPPTEPDETA